MNVQIQQEEDDSQLSFSSDIILNENIDSEGFDLRECSQLEEAIHQFQPYAKLGYTQSEPYIGITSIIISLQNYQSDNLFIQYHIQKKCHSSWFEQNNIQQRIDEIEYLARFLINNEEEQRQKVLEIILIQNKKSFLLHDFAVGLMKEKDFVLANKYFDLFQTCVESENIGYDSKCLIFGCLSVLDQEAGLIYLYSFSTNPESIENLRLILNVLVILEFLEVALNICLFLEKKFNNHLFLYELEEKLEIECYSYHYIQRNLEEIIQIYQIMIEKFPTKIEFYKNISQILFRIDDESAFLYSKKSLEIFPFDYNFHYFIGEKYSKKGNTKEAVFHYEKIIQIYIREVKQFDLDLSVVYRKLGGYYYKLFQFKKAAYCFKKSLFTQRRELIFFSQNKISEIYSQLANSYHQLQDYKKCFEILPLTDFSSERISFLLLDIKIFQTKQNILQNILDYVIKIANNNPNCLLTHALLIQLFNEDKQPEMSQVYLAIADEIYFKNKKKYYYDFNMRTFVTSADIFKQIKISFLIEQNQLDEAEKEAIEYFETNQFELTILFLIKIYKRKGETQKYNSFKDLMNKSESQCLNIVRYLLKYQIYEKANYLLNIYCKLKKKDFSFYNELGYCQECLGYIDEAIESYKLYIAKVQTDNTSVLYNLGNILYKRQQFEEAKQYFEKCIITDTKFALVYQKLGLIAKQEKLYEKAMGLFEQAISINSELIDSLLEVIDINLQWIESSDFDKMNRYLEMARNINSQDLRIKKLTLLLKIKQQKIQ